MMRSLFRRKSKDAMKHKEPHKRLFVFVRLTAYLITSPAAGPSVIAAAGLRLVAALAEDGTISARFKRNCCLLAASGADYRCSLRYVRAIAATTTAVATAPTALVVILFCLTACLAPLRRRIATLAEKCLIGSGKCEFLSTVAAGELQVPSHISSLA
jgi:hypothetical protein